jgi:hypothetical protein
MSRLQGVSLAKGEPMPPATLSGIAKLCKFATLCLLAGAALPLQPPLGIPSQVVLVAPIGSPATGELAVGGSCSATAAPAPAAATGHSAAWRRAFAESAGCAEAATTALTLR